MPPDISKMGMGTKVTARGRTKVTCYFGNFAMSHCKFLFFVVLIRYLCHNIVYYSTNKTTFYQLVSLNDGSHLKFILRSFFSFVNKL